MEWNVLASRLKNRSQKKAFLIFRELHLFHILGNGNPKKFVIFQEIELSHTSGNGNPKNFL